MALPGSPGRTLRWPAVMQMNCQYYTDLESYDKLTSSLQIPAPSNRPASVSWPILGVTVQIRGRNHRVYCLLTPSHCFEWTVCSKLLIP